MTNTEIYKKTLGFSVRRMLWDILAVLGAVVLTGAAFWIAEKTSDKGLIGLAVGGVIALIGLWYVLRFMSYTYKAGQIAMMTRAVSGEDLPEDVIGEGKKVVRERFATVALFFAATRVIRGIFSQIGRAITSIGEKVGGDTGRSWWPICATAAWAGCSTGRKSRPARRPAKARCCSSGTAKRWPGTWAGCSAWVSPPWP